MARQRILITGASGYIGSRLAELAAQRGFRSVALGSPRATAAETHFSWRLGESPPTDIFDNVIAVVHLAHSWNSDTEHGISEANLNLSGSGILAKAALLNGVPRFVFASTTSARPSALNAYGRVKNMIEGRLLGLPQAPGCVVCARIGLVYGGPERGLYGLLSKLVRLAPLLPMIGLGRKVQPIYRDEVCEGLLALALNPLPGTAGEYVLAGPEPITFAHWLKILRRAHTGKGLLVVPVPIWIALLACDLTRYIPFVPTVDRERVLGLASTEPMESAADLAALGVDIVPPAERLKSPRRERRKRTAEAFALLSYVTGQRVTSKTAVVRLVRGIDRLDSGPLDLPRFVIKHPAILRVLEPIRPHATHRLAQRLHLAAMVAESVDAGGSRVRPKISSLASNGLAEIVAMPFRLLFGRLYA